MDTTEVCVRCLLSLLFVPFVLPSGPFTAEEWMQEGREELNLALNLRHNLDVAKNVIIFIGDGMGVSTVTAARIYKGQKHGQPGEETLLNFEQFPNAAFAKTYNTDKQVPDSAGTSTAFMSGVKANSGTLGVDARVRRQNCSLLPDAAVSTIMDWAMAAGKWAGLVTTTHVTHATPAAAYAHTPEREWESDAQMWFASDLCKAKVKDIASQLVEDAPNKDIRVILGGGRKFFLPRTALDPNSLRLNVEGRLDGHDLVKAWLKDKERRDATASYVWNTQQLHNVDVNNTDFLLGLFSQGHMAFDLIRNISGKVTEPSLSEMVTKAIGILSKNPQGFFLLVEGGRIDHAHHVNRAHLALGDTVAMDEAVATATQMTGDDTLVVVTADHSHVFTMGGYPDKGHDILGLVEHTSEKDKALDDMPYTTLSYANGPGPGRVNLTGVDTTFMGFQQSRLVSMGFETHAGEDVAIYARGPMAHLFHGVHEQSYIAHVMAFAACLGPHTQHCHNRSDSSHPVKEATNNMGAPEAADEQVPVPCELPSSAANSKRLSLELCAVCVSVWLLLLSCLFLVDIKKRKKKKKKEAAAEEERANISIVSFLLYFSCVL
ncbi:alkaline phosphatase, tissue-nonspecific isozyme-like isoform X2 [Babylonia areolata]